MAILFARALFPTKQIRTNFRYPHTKHISMWIAYFSASLCKGNMVFGIVSNSFFFLRLCVARFRTTFFVECPGCLIFLVPTTQSIW